MTELASSLPATARATLEHVAAVAEALAEWHALPVATFGDPENCTLALATIARWDAEVTHRAQDAACAAAETAVTAFEARAGGGRDSVGSWKARLDASSTWEAVVREALHYLLPSRGPAAHAKLEDTHSAVARLLQRLPASDPRRAPLETRAASALEVSRVTISESFLLHVILHTPPDRQALKIKQKMAAMRKEPPVSPASIQPLVWSRSLAIAAQV